MFRKLSVRMSIVLCYVLNLSCEDVDSSKNENNSDSFRNIRITINSPYSCYNEISLNNIGAGTCVFGYHNSNQSSTIRSKKEFLINSGNDKDRIDSIIKDITSRLPVNSPYMDDGYQFILTVDNKKIIDRYGQDSLLDKVLIVLVPYVQNDENGQCDFFNLFKHTL